MRTELRLPQCRALLSGTKTPPLRVLVLGGRRPDPQWLRAVAEGREIWCADAGADACLEAGVVPDRLIGDLDSISEGAWAWAEAKEVPLERYPAEKDETDFQLALKAPFEGALLVTGCWGGRFDHAFSNVFSASSAAGPRVLCLADEREVLFPLTGPAPEGLLLLDLPVPPLALSLLPLTAAARVSAQGVKWPLEDAPLTQSHPYAISNVPGRKVRIEVVKGTIGVYAVYSSNLAPSSLEGGRGDRSSEMTAESSPKLAGGAEGAGFPIRSSIKPTTA